MSLLIKRIIQSKGTLILFIFYMMIILLSAFFLIFTYYSQLKQVESQRKTLLLAIASGAASGIDGDAYELMLKRHPRINDIKTLREDSTYYKMYDQLHRIQLINRLQAPITSMVYDSSLMCFRYVVRSDNKVYYLNTYKLFPDKLFKNYNKGGVLDTYMSGNSQWISAFYPIRNSNGNVVGLVQADEKFESFIKDVNSKFIRYMLICLLFILIVTIVLLPIVRRMLVSEEKLFTQLKQQKSELEKVNADLSDSVNYASSIQRTIFPSEDQMSDCFDEHFILNIPKDIVSGDFYWIHKTECEQIIAVSDCTGHGVPGAMMSMMGITLLNSIIRKKKGANSVSQILTTLDEEVDKLLTNTTENHYDGMDISILKINEESRNIKFSGAMSSIVIIGPDQKLRFIKGNRFPIGGKSLYNKSDFTEFTIEYEPQSWLYLYSDGYVDQFGGTNDKKFSRKRFHKLLSEVSAKPCEEQLRIFNKTILDWKGYSEQIDDILVIGIKLS